MADVTIPALPNKATPVITDLLEISANPGSFHITLGSLSAIYQPINEKAVANGYASLDAGGLVPVAQMTTLNLIPVATGAVNINSQNLNNILNADVEGYVDIAEIVSPANPAANIGRLYVKDVSTVTTLFFRDFAGNDTNISTPAVTIDDLTDVTITTRAANEVLVVNGGNTSWINALLVNANLASGVFANITGMGTQSQAFDLNNNNLVNAGDINTDGFIDIAEITTPANPAVNIGRLYVKDVSTKTDLFFRDSAGLEVNISNPITTLEGLSDTTITAVAAHEVLVRNAGNTAWVNELLDNDNLASGTFNNITGLPGVVTFETIDTPAVLTLTPNRSTPAAGVIGDIVFVDNDSVPTTQEFGRIRVSSLDVTTTTEDATMTFRVVEGGSLSNYMLFNDSSSGAIAVLKDIDMFDNAIIFTSDTASPPANSLNWIAHEFGVLWYHAPTGSQHDFAINGSSLVTVKIQSGDDRLDLHNTTEVFGALNVQFGNSATLPDSFLRYIQYGTTPGLLINAASGDTIHLTLDGAAAADYSFNTTRANFLNPNATSILELEANHTVPADAQIVGEINFIDDDSVGTRRTYGQIRTVIQDPTTASEDGELFLAVIEAGTVSDYISLHNAGGLDITLHKPVDFSSQNATNLGTLNTHTIPGGTDTFTLLNATQTLDAKTLTNVGAVTMVNRFQYDKGADVASGGIVTLGNDGNVFDITGVTTINEILATGWQAGSVIHLQFDGILTVTNNSAGTNDILLADGANMTTAAGDVLTLFFNGIDWIEVTRSTIANGEANTHSSLGGGSFALTAAVPKTGVNLNLISVSNGDGMNAALATDVLTLAVAATVVQTDQANTFGAFLQSFVASSMRIPASAAPTMAVDGDFAIDTTITDFSHGLIKYFDGEELVVVALPVAQITTPTDGHVVSYNATNDEFELVAAGGGEVVTWTADHSAARFNLENTGAIDFSLSGPLVTPASTQPYITYDIGPTPDAMRINVPAARTIFFSVGGTDEMELTNALLDLFGNSLDNVAVFTSNAGTPATLGAMRFGNAEEITWRNAGNTANNSIYFNNVDEFQIEITNGVDYSFSETQFDLNSNQLANASVLGLTASGASLGAGVNNIFATASGMTFNTIAADSFFMTINAVTEYTFNRDEIIFGENNNIEFGTTTGTRIGTATTQKLSFYNATPIIRPTALTAQDTSITHTAPSVADFAIQDLTSTTPFGFVTKDEGNTVLQVILNLQTRVQELEDKLQSLGLVA